MKGKRLLFAVALVTGMLGWNNIQAQTDVTSTYIANAGFEGEYKRFLDINNDRGVQKPNGWSVEWYQDNNDKNGMTFNATSINQDNQTWNAKSGNAYFARMRWANSTIYLRQTLSYLRPGNYTLAFSAATHTGAAGKNSLTISVAGQNQTIAAEDNANGDWTDYSIDFSITSATPYATIEVKGVREDGLFKFGIDEFTLTYDGSSYYEKILSNAQALLDNNVDWAVDTNNALSTAISSNSGKTTVDEKNAAIIALEEAMATYKANNSTDVTNYITNATFDSNIDGWTCTGGDGNNFQRNSSAQTNFNGGFLEKWRNAWNGTYNQKNFDVYQNLTKLPKGEYTIKAAIIAVMQGDKETLSDNYKNKKHGGPYYIDDDHGVWLYGTSGENTGKAWANTNNNAFGGGTGEIKTATVNVTDGNLTIGFKGIGSPNGGTELGTYANWIACDNWTLSYFGFDPTVLKANLQALQDEATEFLANATYSNVKGAERTSLATLSTATPEETKSALETAIRDIQDAIAAFTAAKPNYDALVAEIAKADALGADVTDAQAVVNSQATTAADALAAIQNLKVTEYNYVTNTYQHGVELGTWQAEGPTGSLTEQHWSGESRPYLEQSSAAWNSGSWEIKYYQDLLLPAGKYVFKVAGRQANSDKVSLSLTVKNGETVLGTVSDFPRGDTGRGIDKSGATNFSPEGSYANNNAGRGFEWRYVQFTLEEAATVNVAVEAKATDEHMWVSFCDATVLTDNANLIANVPGTLGAGKFATRIFPFKPEKKEGVNFYSCATKNGNALTLIEVPAPEANTPYILENASEAEINITQKGFDFHVDAEYTAGLLTGVFAENTITSGYVLQTQNDKQAFYKVVDPITVPAYRAYLNTTGEVKAFYLGGDDATAINALDALTSGAYEGIYSVDGVKLNRIEKGVNILKMADGTTRKVIVK